MLSGVAMVCRRTSTLRVFQLQGQPAHDVAAIFQARRLRLHQHVAAEFVVFLDQRDIVTAFGGNHGGLHAGGAAADNHDFFFFAAGTTARVRS